MEMDEFRLYVVGMTPKTKALIDGLKGMLDKKLPQAYRLDVIDLLTHPDRGSVDNVIVTPTLVKTSCTPVIKIIGDMTDRRKLAGKLGLNNNDSFPVPDPTA